MAKINPFKFLQEVRAEDPEGHWPTRRETAITTAMVFVMVGRRRRSSSSLRIRSCAIVVTLVLGIGS